MDMVRICGTAGYTGPGPGDPDNSAGISAAPAFGGVDITWVYPGVNPHAVAYFKLYRSTSGTEGTQTLLTTVNGDFFYDKTVGTSTTEYFYWVSVVSANDGHEGPMIGPVSAAARPTIEDLMAQMSARIDAGHLAQGLREEIQSIGGVASDLATETTARIFDYEVVSQAFGEMQTDVANTNTLLVNESLERKTADSAQVQSLNLAFAQHQENSALITDETEARANEDEALGRRINTIQAADVAIFRQGTEPDPEELTIQDKDLWINTDAEDGSYPMYQYTDGEWVSTVDQTLAGSFASLEAESMARVDRDGAIAREVSNLEATVKDLPTDTDVSANIRDNNVAMIGYCSIDGSVDSNIDTYDACVAAGGRWLAATPLAEAVKTVQVKGSDGETASVQQKMQAFEDDLGVLNTSWTVKVDSGTGLVGGFGLFNDGETVEAGFNVDKFWVGRSKADGTLAGSYPFIIKDDEVFMKEAVIESLTFNKLRSSDGSVSIGIVDGQDRLKADFIDADNLTVRQMKSTTDVTLGGTTAPAFEFKVNGSYALRGKDTEGGVIQDSEGIKVYDNNGVLRVVLGKL